MQNIGLIDRDPVELEAATNACIQFGVQAIAYPANVSSENEMTEVLDKIVSDFGALTTLVDNAGIVADGLLVKV